METEWSNLQPSSSYSPERFTPQVYEQVMSGKPRFSGAQAALEYFNALDAATRSKAYGDRKQSIVIDLIEAGEFTAYPDALRFIVAVKDAGIRVAAASSSKNADLLLRQIRLDTFAEENGLESEHVTPGLTLLEFFDADISGRDFAQGKPHPAIFLTGATELARPAEQRSRLLAC
jgi:beta-phosphoglucomutase-like phosphatase (HAD superfamily)